MKHGIAIREKRTNRLFDFIECRTGIKALRVLSGVRHNLNKEDYKAEEELVKEEELKELLVFKCD